MSQVPEPFNSTQITSIFARVFEGYHTTQLNTNSHCWRPQWRPNRYTWHLKWHQTMTRRNIKLQPNLCPNVCPPTYAKVIDYQNNSRSYLLQEHLQPSLTTKPQENLTNDSKKGAKKSTRDHKLVNFVRTGSL